MQAVIVNGQMRDDLIATGSVAFTDIQENQHMVVILKDAPSRRSRKPSCSSVPNSMVRAVSPPAPPVSGYRPCVTWVPADGWHIRERSTPQPHTGDAFLPWLAGGICLAAAIALLVWL